MLLGSTMTERERAAPLPEWQRHGGAASSVSSSSSSTASMLDHTLPPVGCHRKARQQREGKGHFELGAQKQPHAILRQLQSLLLHGQICWSCRNSLAFAKLARRRGCQVSRNKNMLGGVSCLT